MTVDHPYIKAKISAWTDEIRLMTGDNSMVLIAKSDAPIYEPEQIFNAVSDVTQVPIEKILRRTKLSHIVAARQIVSYFLRNHCYLSLHAIADYFKQDHTTVISSLKKVKKEIQNKEGFLFICYSKVDALLSANVNR
jgi:chromosomal replication initiator protein